MTTGSNKVSVTALQHGGEGQTMVMVIMITTTMMRTAHSARPQPKNLSLPP